MPSIRRSILAFAIAGMLQQAAPALAQADDPSTRHLRPDPGLRALVDEAAARSPSIRASIDRIEAMNVLVYVRTRLFPQTRLEGRVGLIGVANGRRVLAVELACARPQLIAMATLGHELFHAAEIAEEPSIVDTQTLAAFYRTHGLLTDNRAGQLTFETEGAEAAGRRAWREITSAGERHTWTSK